MKMQVVCGGVKAGSFEVAKMVTRERGIVKEQVGDSSGKIDKVSFVKQRVQGRVKVSSLLEVSEISQP